MVESSWFRRIRTAQAFGQASGDSIWLPCPLVVATWHASIDIVHLAPRRQCQLR